eukprot:scaffold612_cov95-Isochrysis_galbana.AAC.1
MVTGPLQSAAGTAEFRLNTAGPDRPPRSRRAVPTPPGLAPDAQPVPPDKPPFATPAATAGSDRLRAARPPLCLLSVSVIFPSIRSSIANILVSAPVGASAPSAAGSASADGRETGRPSEGGSRRSRARRCRCASVLKAGRFSANLTGVAVPSAAAGVGFAAMAPDRFTPLF